MRAIIKENDNFEIPLTPLIDVVFLLLIFFLVATNFTRKEYDQQVNLPQTKASVASKYDTKNLILNIRHDGNLILNGRVLDPGTLPDKLNKWQEAHTAGHVIIRSDGAVKYRKIMQIMGICKNAGIKRVDLPVIKEN